MISNYYYLLSCIALGAVLTSCQKEDLGDLGSTDDESYQITITAFEDKVDSKVSIDERTFSWETGDLLTAAKMSVRNISAQSTYRKSYISNFTAKGTGNKTDFEGAITRTDEEYFYSVYPSLDRTKISYQKEATGTPLKVTFNLSIPTLQKNIYLENKEINPTAIDEYVLMYGKSTESVASKTTFSMGMKHLMTYFDLKLSGLDINQKIDKVVLQSDVAIFAQTAKYECYSKDNTENKGGITLSGAQKSVTAVLYNSEGSMGIMPKGDGTLTVRLAVAIMNQPEAVKMTVTAYNGDFKIGDNITGSLTKRFLAGVQYNAPISFPTLKSASLVKGTETISIDAPETVKDLTITGKALEAADFTYIKNNMPYLESLNIAGTKTAAIPDYAFNLKELLKNITFNTTGELKTIGLDAFYSTSLTEVTIPASVEEIKDRAFQKTKLSSITFQDDSQLHTFGVGVFHSTLLAELTIPKNVTKIGNYLCNGCSLLKTISFENNSKMIILSNILASTSKLETINLPSGLTHINANVFTNCRFLNNVIIPASVKNLGTTVFTGCSKLTTITFEGSVPPVIAKTTFLGSGNTPTAQETNTPPIVNIYVPSVTTYQGAKSWTEHNPQVKGEVSSTIIALVKAKT